jgi:hypothetical protein
VETQGENADFSLWMSPDEPKVRRPKMLRIS